MNLSKSLKHRIEDFRIPLAPATWLSAAFVALVGLPMATSFAQDSIVEEQGTQVLTRGPVHEAFAGVISFDAQPGIVVSAAPPGLIEEIPPGERPEGDDVTWIPGYWAWDDERNDFLWISGIWRALPPGREWIVGYWGETTEGFQWTSGYWADVSVTETTYLPAPPKTLEEGPNIDAPSSSHGWTPGSWHWRQERYAWSPGYWAEGRADWDWIPAHYVWTRRGHVYVGGYWDYAVERRGVLFAPVYFERGVYSRPGYSYSPSIVIDLGIFTSHLFLRPQYDHYYFGDYYAPRYNQSGFYASFSYQSSRRGYDPFYAHQRWRNRDNRDWERDIERDFVNRRDNENARPPHTWAAQREMEAGRPENRRDRSMLATSFDQLSKREDSSMSFQPVAQDDRELLARRGQEVQQSREQRRALEVKDAEGQREAGDQEASKVPSPKSPIASRADREGKGTGRPPEPQRSPGSEPGSASETESGRPGSDSPVSTQPGRPAMGDRGKGGAPVVPEIPNTIPQPEQPGRPAMDGKSKEITPDAPQEPTTRPQPEQPGRPAMEDRGKGRTPDAPQAPTTRPQPEQPGRPAMEDRGKGRTPDAPQAPTTRPQPEQPGRPAMEDRGKGRTPDAPQAPTTRPQPEQPGRPAMEERGKGRAPDAPQAPTVRPQQPPAQPQAERPTREVRENSQPAAPRMPRSNPQPAPAPPKADRPATEDRGRENKEENDQRDRKKN